MPATIDRLSLICVRQISSSTFGCRKNGLPNRNVGPKPMPVSAARFGFDRGARAALARIGEVRLVEHRRRERREPVQVADVDARRVAFDAVGRRAVGGDVERLVLLARVIEVAGRRDVVLSAIATTSSLASSAVVLIGWSIGRPSSWPTRALMKSSSAVRWQSGLLLISASLLLDRSGWLPGRRCHRAAGSSSAAGSCR